MHVIAHYDGRGEYSVTIEHIPIRTVHQLKTLLGHAEWDMARFPLDLRELLDTLHDAIGAVIVKSDEINGRKPELQKVCEIPACGCSGYAHP